jgi:hypothetical protein
MHMRLHLLYSGYSFRLYMYLNSFKFECIVLRTYVLDKTNAHFLTVSRMFILHALIDTFSIIWWFFGFMGFPHCSDHEHYNTIRTTDNSQSHYI